MKRQPIVRLALVRSLCAYPDRRDRDPVDNPIDAAKRDAYYWTIRQAPLDLLRGPLGKGNRLETNAAEQVAHDDLRQIRDRLRRWWSELTASPEANEGEPESAGQEPSAAATTGSGALATGGGTAAGAFRPAADAFGSATAYHIDHLHVRAGGLPASMSADDIVDTVRELLGLIRGWYASVNMAGSQKPMRPEGVAAVVAHSDKWFVQAVGDYATALSRYGPEHAETRTRFGEIVLGIMSRSDGSLLFPNDTRVLHQHAVDLVAKRYQWVTRAPAETLTNEERQSRTWAKQLFSELRRIEGRSEARMADRGYKYKQAWVLG